MNRLTALIIQSHPDMKDGYGIYVDAATTLHSNGKWAGWISFWRDGRPHISPLVSTEPVYDSPEEAVAEMNRLVEEVRKMDVS